MWKGYQEENVPRSMSSASNRTAHYHSCHERAPQLRTQCSNTLVE